MSKKRPKKTAAAGRTESSKQAPKQQPEQPASRWSLPSSAAVREAVESVVIAFVLAFLFRTFEAEAFVIPTGSMAPTLMGRHKDVVCANCGYSYQVSASEEVDENGHWRDDRAQVVGGTCPMCRYPMDFTPGNPQEESYPSYKGDRILVNKFAYQLDDPERWDVAVFKFPGEAKTNYIKRLVGLPNETLRISHGDIFVRPEGAEDFTIARKPPAKMLAMLQPVFDTEVAPQLIEQGWPARWQSGDGWKAGPERRTFEIHEAAGDAWLRYRHLVPSAREWRAFLRGAPPPESIQPQLISDFSAYNAGWVKKRRGAEPESAGLHWVGDLALRATVQAESDAGAVRFELVEAGRRFQCRVDLSTGEATLSIDGLEDFHPTAKTALHGPGEHEVVFANVDDQLRFWVDGTLVEFDVLTTYPPLDKLQPKPADRRPVGIAAIDGASLRVGPLAISRDIYYIAGGGKPVGFYDNHQAMTDFFDVQPLDEREPEHFGQIQARDFYLGPDQFLALGDNSPKSKDGRLWGTEYYVKRELLIGEALLIYWPHSWNRIPYVNIPFPMFPNFSRMGFVR